jgi:hypothetical protein
MGQLNELKLLQRSKEEQAQELLTLKAQKEAEISQKSKLEKKLAKQHEDWRERPVPDEPISILEGLQQTAQKEAGSGMQHHRYRLSARPGMEQGGAGYLRRIY